MANNPRKQIQRTEKKGIPNQKTTVNKFQLPPMIVDQNAQVPDTTAGPSRVQQIVQQTERMAVQKNFIGNKKKAAMDILNYLGSLKSDNRVNTTPPISNAIYRSENELPTSNRASRRSVNFIKLNKLKLALQQIENTNKKLEQKKQKYAKVFKLKEFSKVPSKYMKDYTTIVQSNENNYVLSRYYDVRSNRIVGTETRQREKIPNVKKLKSNLVVPSRYMNCYRKIHLQAMQNKVEFNNHKNNTKQDNKTKKINKPFYYKKNFRKENTTQVRHAQAITNSRIPLKVNRFHNFTAPNVHKHNYKKKIDKKVKSRYMNFMKILKREQVKKEVLRETSAQETQKRKREAFKRKLRKQVCGGAYNREWERRYKEQVAKWLRTRNVHLLHNAAVKPANVPKKTVQLKMKLANKTMKRTAQPGRTIKKTNTKSLKKISTLLETMPLINHSEHNRSVQRLMETKNNEMKKIVPRTIRKAKTNTLKKSPRLLTTMKRTRNAVKSARTAKQSGQKAVQNKKKPRKAITLPMKHGKDNGVKRNNLRRIQETNRQFTSDNSDHSMSYLYYSNPPRRYAVNSYLNSTQPEMGDVKRFTSYTNEIGSDTS